MHTKLTLRLNQDLIGRMKVMAGRHHLSLSELVARYFRNLLSAAQPAPESSPVLAEISGVLQGKDRGNAHYRGIYRRHLENKYLGI
jgi:hypothetical protein